MATEKQKKVAKKLSENIRSKKTKTQGQILVESGYSETTKERPSQVIQSKGVQKELKDVLNKLEKERQRLLKSLETDELSNVKYKDKVSSIDILTKNIQLLSGGNTEKISFDLNDKEQSKKAINEFIENNS